MKCTGVHATAKSKRNISLLSFYSNIQSHFCERESRRHEGKKKCLWSLIIHILSYIYKCVIVVSPLLRDNWSWLGLGNPLWSDLHNVFQSPGFGVVGQSVTSCSCSQQWILHSSVSPVVHWLSVQ